MLARCWCQRVIPNFLPEANASDADLREAFIQLCDVCAADGAARAGTYRDPGGGWLRWSDDALWIGAGTGTWSRFPAAGATG